MKKRHNSAPLAPDEASPYLNESSRCAESESEEHFVRKAHFSAHFLVKKCCFSVQQKSQNCVEIKFQRNIWGQPDVRTRMRASRSWNFDLEKPIKTIKMDSCVIFADHVMMISHGSFVKSCIALVIRAMYVTCTLWQPVQCVIHSYRWWVHGKVMRSQKSGSQKKIKKSRNWVLNRYFSS